MVGKHVTHVAKPKVINARNLDFSSSDAQTAAE